MKKLILPIVLVSTSFMVYGQGSTTEIKPQLQTTSTVTGEKTNFPQAKITPTTPVLSDYSSEGGVENKEEILQLRKEGSSQPVTPQLSIGQSREEKSPKNNY